MPLRKKLKSGSQRTAQTDYVKLICQMFISFDLLGLYSFLKHIQILHTRNVFAEGILLVVYNQFAGKRFDIQSTSAISNLHGTGEKVRVSEYSR